MPRRVPYSPHPRRYPPLSARDVRARRRGAGRIAFGCVAVAALVLLAGAVDWAGLERAAETGAREAVREELQEAAPMHRQYGGARHDVPGEPQPRRGTWRIQPGLFER